MGCPCECRIYAETEVSANEGFEAVQVEVDRLDRKYSHYRDDSTIQRLQGRASYEKGVRVDDETASLLNYAQTQWRLSEGLFDVTAHHLTRLWSDTRTIPGAVELEAALRLTGWHRVSWDGRCLRLPPGFSFDLGGVVKEYAADRAALALRRQRLTHGYVDLGGDFHFIGPHPDGTAWQAGIRDPRQRDQAIASISVSSGGLASSGDYERFTRIGDERYSHLVDPRSGWPLQRSRENLRAVSVIAPTCLVAGSVSTLAMLMGAERGLALLQESGLEWVAVTGDGATVSPAAGPGRGSRRRNLSAETPPSC
jgi:thiamine biosynthesis lipoprotein